MERSVTKLMTVPRKVEMFEEARNEYFESARKKGKKHPETKEWEYQVASLRDEILKGGKWL